MDHLIQFFIALILAVTTAGMGFLFGQRKNRDEMKRELNIAVWKERTAAYKDLMRAMKLFPNWPSRKEESTAKDLKVVGQQFCDWYFSGGGLFLTPPSKEKYFEVQEELEKLLKNKQEDDSIKGEYEKICRVLSGLRTELINDLLSRERDLLMTKNDSNKNN